MRDYQRTKNNNYRLPHTVYLHTLSFIRTYQFMKDEMHDMAVATPSRDEGMPGGSNLVKEVEVKVKNREHYFKQVQIIEKALDIVPDEYKKGVWENIQYNKRYPLDAAKSTYGYWKARFIYTVAINAGYYF